MELRNVIFAVSLSFAILFGWSVIFDTPEEKQKRLERAESRNQTSTAPSVNAESNNIENISREDAINMLVNGFCKDVIKELPLEFAQEAKQLLALKLENSVG